MLLTVDNRNIDEISPEEQLELVGIVAEDYDLTVPQAVERIFGHLRRRRQDGAYMTCKTVANKVGKHEDTIREEFRQEKSGVIKRTHSGRNRKTYTVLLISKTAAQRHYPDAVF